MHLFGFQKLSEIKAYYKLELFRIMIIDFENITFAPFFRSISLVMKLVFGNTFLTVISLNIFF